MYSNPCQPEYGEQDIRRISIALHDLCQPLTTLQCRLELAQMMGTPEAYREAVDAAMIECGRLAESVSSMRDTVRAASQKLDGLDSGDLSEESR